MKYLVIAEKPSVSKSIAKVIGAYRQEDGYRLVRTPAEYTIGSILRITEGSMAPVACLDDHPNQCERASSCKTLQMWEGFYKLLN